MGRLCPRLDCDWYVQVLNMVGPEGVQAALCHRVCYPRLLLRCAALREVTFQRFSAVVASSFEMADIAELTLYD